MATLTSELAFDMTKLLVSYQVDSGPRTLTVDGQSALQWELSYPGGFFPPVQVTLTGTGLTGPGAAGTVTGLTIVLDRFDPTEPKLEMTGFSVPLSTLLPGGTVDALNLPEFFAGRGWSADTMTVTGEGAKMFGDVDTAVSGVRGYASDTFNVTGVDATIYCDARVISGNLDLFGGWDRVIVNADSHMGVRVYGDAQSLDGATLRGGGDQITVNGTDIRPGLSQNFLHGDVEVVRGAAALTGGDDEIIGGLDITDQIFGDALLLDSATASVTGGDDLIRGRSGNDLLYGDIDNLYRGVLTGGNDTIEGGTGDDYLFGDYGRQTFGTVVSGGADLLKGGPGNDALVGNEGNDTLGGGTGNDTMVGGDGNDRIWGYTGTDLIAGERGKDVLTGGPDADTFLYRDPIEAVPGGNKETITDFEAGVDVLDLRQAADFSTTGGLVWTGAYTGATGSIGYTAYSKFILLQANLDSDSAKEMVIRLDGLSSFDPGDMLL